METWKPVSQNDYYEVSNQGRVRSLITGLVLKPQARRHGYLAVWLHRNGEKKQASVHRLVAEEFCEKRPGATEVNHINEIKTDNRAENLEWCTHQENCVAGTVQARRAALQKNGKKSKRIVQCALDGTPIREFPSMAEATRQTGTWTSAICLCANGKQEYANGYKWFFAT